MTAGRFELGLNSFTDGDRVLSDAETLRLIFEDARLAESAGLETVARRIAVAAKDLRLSRFDLKYDIMHLPREARARTIELLGREVAPRVRELLAKEPTHV